MKKKLNEMLAAMLIEPNFLRKWGASERATKQIDLNKYFPFSPAICIYIKYKALLGPFFSPLLLENWKKNKNRITISQKQFVKLS